MHLSQNCVFLEVCMQQLRFDFMLELLFWNKRLNVTKKSSNTYNSLLISENHRVIYWVSTFTITRMVVFPEVLLEGTFWTDVKYEKQEKKNLVFEPSIIGSWWSAKLIYSLHYHVKLDCLLFDTKFLVGSIDERQVNCCGFFFISEQDAMQHRPSKDPEVIFRFLLGTVVVVT